MESHSDSEEHASRQATLRVYIRGGARRNGDVQDVELRVKAVLDSIERCDQIWDIDPGHRHGECNVQSARLVTRSLCCLFTHIHTHTAWGCQGDNKYLVRPPVSYRLLSLSPLYPL